MGNVTIITCEPTGAALDQCVAHFDAVAEAKSIWAALCKLLGATAMRPGHDGRPPRTFIFEGPDAPSGWVYVSRPRAGAVEARPHKGTKIGRAAAERIAALPAAPSDRELASALGHHELPTDDRSIYFATATELTFPRRRFFLRFPIGEGSTWRPRDDLAQVRESDFMRALEDHNAEARRRRESTAAAAHQDIDTTLAGRKLEDQP